jgi:hypothetical protein
MVTVGDPAYYSLNDESDRTQMENRIHDEFWTAFTAWDNAPDGLKDEAASRLNQSVRQLYDFVVRGKAPRRMGHGERAF